MLGKGEDLKQQAYTLKALENESGKHGCSVTKRYAFHFT